MLIVSLILFVIFAFLALILTYGDCVEPHCKDSSDALLTFLTWVIRFVWLGFGLGTIAWYLRQKSR